VPESRLEQLTLEVPSGVVNVMTLMVPSSVAKLRTAHVGMDMVLLSDTSSVVMGGFYGVGEWCRRVEKALKERPCSPPPEASGGGTCGQGGAWSGRCDHMTTELGTWGG
jgi:hypothetical protein